ncbi:MAG: hypothetical protein JWO08_1581 [Verrucomicrobiaceae bacterium]|nr:hypothetical protein [Verrucomicrobiaceae bacterium]
MPVKIGDVFLPAFRAVAQTEVGSDYSKPSHHFLALSPFIWLWSFYFRETEGVRASFNAYRLKHIEFVERQIRSSREAQAVLDRQERMASSRPQKPLARAAKQAVASAPPGLQRVESSSRSSRSSPQAASPPTGLLAGFSTFPRERERASTAARPAVSCPPITTPEAGPPSAEWFHRSTDC